MVVQLLEGILITVSQAINKIEYQRRFNILNTLENTSSVNNLLKTHFEDLSESKELFGEKFRAHISKDCQARKQSIEMFAGLKKQNLTNSRSKTIQQPFPKGPVPQGSGSGRGRSFFNAFGQRGKGFFSKFKKPVMLETSKFPNLHPLVETLFPVSHLDFQNLPAAGRLKWFLRNWEILTQDPQILDIVVSRYPCLQDRNRIFFLH